jgi:tetratricopeptide (TPR) repeat protein
MVQFSVSRPALEINAANDNAHYFRGLAYFYQSLYDKAIGDFNKCLELDPKLADAYFNKALALEAAGRQAEAREAYAAFLRFAPPEAKDQIEQARRWLQK